VIASLNGFTPGGWTSIARKFQEAGADAIELNVYFLAASVEDTSAEVESRYVALVESVTKQVSIRGGEGGAVLSAMANMAGGLAKGGARGLVLFNRFLQPHPARGTGSGTAPGVVHFRRAAPGAALDRDPARRVDVSLGPRRRTHAEDGAQAAAGPVATV